MVVFMPSRMASRQGTGIMPHGQRQTSLASLNPRSLSHLTHSRSCKSMSPSAPRYRCPSTVPSPSLPRSQSGHRPHSLAAWSARQSSRPPCLPPALKSRWSSQPLRSSCHPHTRPHRYAFGWPHLFTRAAAVSPRDDAMRTLHSLFLAHSRPNNHLGDEHHAQRMSLNGGGRLSL